MKRSIHSWGRLGSVLADVDRPQWRDQIHLSPTPILPYGLGRSYGDSCLLTDGRMIETRSLDRILNFCPQTGRLRAECGISLDEILQFCVPRGWFLPTTPGTRQVTLGGAIANDVHGKNHHLVGCFGNHVPVLELLRTDGTLTTVHEGDPLHSATIGGLGLTGIITWADIQLAPIQTSLIDAEYVRFRGLEEFQQLSSESSGTWEHTVAWIDCLGKGSSLGRGIFIRGNWAGHGPLDPHKAPMVSIPVDFPRFALNRHSIGAFNSLYYHRFIGSTKSLQQHYSGFFHPLDSIDGWSRIYGSKGFFQYQCVIPTSMGIEPINHMLRLIAASGQGSFLAVLKTFGSIPSPGILSFPLPGITLALDFSNQGESTNRLFSQLDQIVREANGRWYPAKDARMNAGDFQASFPRLAEFESLMDPGMMSDFWKRMTS